MKIAMVRCSSKIEVRRPKTSIMSVWSIKMGPHMTHIQSALDFYVRKVAWEALWLAIMTNVAMVINATKLEQAPCAEIGGACLTSNRSTLQTMRLMKNIYS